MCCNGSEQYWRWVYMQMQKLNFEVGVHNIVLHLECCDVQYVLLQE